LFTIAQDTKAYATARGKILIYDNDANPSELVNVVVKSYDSKTSSDGLSPGIKYYIYMGLRRSDFIDSSNTDIEANLKAQLISAYPSIQLSDIYISGTPNETLYNRMITNGVMVNVLFVIILNSYHMLLLFLLNSHHFVTMFSKTYWMMDKLFSNIFYEPIYSTPLFLLQLVFDVMGIALSYHLLTQVGKIKMGIVVTLFLLLGTFILLLFFLFVNINMDFSS
jgi:hypothetical protein